MGEVYTCLKGLCALVTAVIVEKPDASTVYTVKLVPAASRPTPFDNNGLKHFTGSFNSKAGVLSWDTSDDVRARSYNIAGEQWSHPATALLEVGCKPFLMNKHIIFAQTTTTVPNSA